ncbi:MAG: tetratricopeptide repeat protein [Acidobacteria bacterium]|nr:tetratricopeptide repeat protein [Acidobacteriota bacterium]
MVSKKKARPSRRQRLASKPASSPQPSTSGATETGKTPSSPLPGEPTRFFDRFSHREAQAALALALLVAVCYLPAMLWGGLTWDDHAWSQSRAVREWAGLGTLWSFPPQIEREVHYWPLTYTTFWLEHKIWGLEPAGYHVVNVLLHLFNTLLVWRLLLRLAVPGAWIAAAVFAVHPTHVESVAWIIERKDVLSGLFYLAAVLVWLRFLEQPRPWGYGLALVLFAAGLLSKSIVVTLPVALLIVQWWKEGRVRVQDLKLVAPFFLLALLHTAVDLASTVDRSSMVSRVGLLDYSLPERMLVASQALWFYAGKLVWPADLAVIYPRWDISLGDPWAWLYLAGAAALAATLWFLRHRIGRGPLAGAVFFAVTLSPVLGFVNHDYMEYSFVADRFQYLAGIGVIGVLVGAAWNRAGRLSGRLRWGAAVLVGVSLALLGTMTWRQAGIYKDEATFFSHVVSLNPRAWKAHYNLSTALIQDGRPEEALAAARIAVQNQPDNADTHTILGVALVRAERFVEAEEILHRALEIDPRHRNGRRFMAETLMKQGRYEEALEGYRAVLEIAPNYPLAYAFMGHILVQLHRYDEAVEPLSKALTLVKAAPSLTPDLPTAESIHLLLGKALQGLGRTQAGVAHFRQVLQLDSHNMEALEHVAASEFRRKRYRQALDLYRRQLEIDPDKATTHANIGAALYFLDRAEEAIRSLERALALDPTLETARENLAAMRKLAK